MITVTDIPLLPRGVRPHFDAVRKTEVLLGPERVLMLDAIGVAIVERIDGVRSLGRISTDLSEVYEAPVEVIEPDVIAFVDDLRAKGFVHVAAR